MLLPEDIEGLHLRPRRRDERGGEWDAVRSWPVRTIRKLRGAGWIGIRNAYAPDQIAHELSSKLGDVSVDEAMEQWRRAALMSISINRANARRRRQDRLARSLGHTSYYEYRSAVVQEAHGLTIHQYCKEKGWR
jgi:hypothetical protein